MKPNRSVLLLTALVVLAGCGQAADTDSGANGGAPGVGDSTDLGGRVFMSTEVTEDGKARPLAEGTTVSLTFTDDGRLLANAGCNQIQGPVRVTDGKLAVSDLSTTDMGCDPQRHEQDTWLADFLGAAPTVKLDGPTMTLTAAERSIVLLDREVAQPDSPLEGPTWVVDALLSSEVAASMPAGASATMVFDAGTVEISTGCNTGSGSYQLQGDKLTFGDLVLTRKACEPDLMQVEQAIVATLAGETTIQLDADRLTVKHPTGNGLQLRANP